VVDWAWAGRGSWWKGGGDGLHDIRRNELWRYEEYERWFLDANTPHKENLTASHSALRARELSKLVRKMELR